MIRTTQSLLFSLIYFIYVFTVMEPAQRLVIPALCALRPKRRPAILRGWFRWQAQVVLGLAHGVGGLRLHVQGAIPEAGLILLMNHQSLLDIPVGVSLLRGPYPVIPTRAKYTKGIPGISSLARLGGFPALMQGARATKAEYSALGAAADAVGRGERCMIIFPEGHRSPDGELQPYMTQGLRLVFRRARARPVYLAVVDGLSRLRGLADLALRVPGPPAHVAIQGPYTIPADPHDHGTFIELLRSEMVAMLDRLRAQDATASTPATLAHRTQRAG